MPTTLFGGGVNGGGVGTAAVEGKNALGLRIVDDGIWIFAGDLDRGDGLDGFQVEDGDGPIAAIAGEALAEVGGESDAVNALGIGQIADDFAGGFVNDHQVRTARDIDAMGIGIHAEVVPTAGAADRNAANHVIRAGLGRSECGRRSKASK